MMVRVRVRASPYIAVKRGSVGEVLEVKFRSTVYEIWKVRFKGAGVWSLRPDELEALNGEAV
jgi:hypothetical protein